MALNWTVLGIVACGGALGSVARAWVGSIAPAGRLPWATIAINVVGSLVIGWLMARLSPLNDANLRSYSFWVVGVCGGFTTFSAFSWQTFEQLQKGNWGAAAANVFLSVGLCLLATWVGWRVAQ